MKLFNWLLRRQPQPATPSTPTAAAPGLVDDGWEEAKRRLARINALCEQRKREMTQLQGGRFVAPEDNSTEGAQQINGEH